MKSEIMDRIEQLGIDPFWIIAALAVMVLILFLVVVVMLVKVHFLTQRYDLFMRGKDCETMEDNIVEIYRKLQMMQNRDMANKDVLRLMNRNVSSSISRTGLVKYNAFQGMGGKSSFALALLNSVNTGYILNAMHSRSSCYLYIKEITEGETAEQLSEEEQQALKIAMDSEKREKRHGRDNKVRDVL